MYYNEGGLGICTISLPVRPLSHCVFFFVIYISDADNPGKNRVNIYLFYT